MIKTTFDVVLETRHLTDTQFRLADNSHTQRQLSEAAQHAEMDLRAKQIQQKLEVYHCSRFYVNVALSFLNVHRLSL